MKKNIFLILLCFTQAYSDHSQSSKIAFAAGTAIGNLTQSKLLIDLSDHFPFQNSAYSYDVDTQPFNMIYQIILRSAAIYSMTSTAYSISIPFIDLNQAVEDNNISKDEFPLVSFGKGFIHGIKRNPFYGLKKLIQGISTGSRWAMKTFPNETFADIAGARQAKKDLQDVVEYLRNPTKFTRLGGKMNKGFLLVGDPGNGKTLLARAVAGEAGCAFFQASGSDFVEMYVGVGAARVRSLFNEARKNAPAIIFIDEFDSLAPKRGSNRSHTETDQTLNQLLVEMDGFNQMSPDKPIIVIGATNRIDILDPAVLRPGRFDRHVMVPYPDVIERKEILTIYCDKVVADPELDIKLIAKETSNFSGADLANLVNQAALMATADGADCVTYKYFIEAQKLLRSEMNLTARTLNRIVPDETFDSVIGAQEAKDELKTIISFLKNPDYYSRLGAKIPRGILLEGQPGTGKTLLARAVAGEAQCSFFKVSGSELVKTFVGEGAEEIQALFKEARKHAPSIIFIDEIDSIGGSREFSGSNSNATLNQLLVEMDGFSQNADKPVIVIGATNRADTLDDALARPGRFDRQIIVPLPDVKTRKEILYFYCKKITIDSSVNVETIAKATMGYSGADLANLVNQAALIATSEGSEVVTANHFTRARELIMLGAVNTSTKMSDKEKKLTAYHEAGHALVYLLCDDTPHVLQQVTIIPRSRALGLTTAQLEEEKYSYSKEELFAMIQVSLGGRIAEEIQFGVVGTGASNDFEKASNIARNMVCVYGMTDALGPINYTQQNNSFGYSQKTAELIDAEVHVIINSAYQKTRALLTTNKDKLDTLAMALLEKETLDKEETYLLLGLQPKQI